MPHKHHRHRADPSNAYHELRRYLLSMGLETRIGTFACIPIPAKMQNNSKVSTNAENWKTIDNFFLFELRRIYRTDARYVNSVAFLFRVFFDNNQDGSSFHVQVVCNHLGHGTLDMNMAYNDVIENLLQADWTKSPHSCDVYSLDKGFKSIKDFKAEFTSLHNILKKHDVLNNHELSNEMQC
jgi:hypothetical protein